MRAQAEAEAEAEEVEPQASVLVLTKTSNNDNTAPDHHPGRDRDLLRAQGVAHTHALQPDPDPLALDPAPVRGPKQARPATALVPYPVLARKTAATPNHM